MLVGGLGSGRKRRRRLTGAVGSAVCALALLAGCVIEDPTIEATGNPGPTAQVPTVDVPSPEPGETPAPTPTDAAATTVPDPTPTQVPTATPVPGPTPLPAITPEADSAPTDRPAGVVAVPVNGTTTFRLAQPRPLLQLPGHSLIYVDGDRQAEVDVFTPVADGNGAPLPDFAAVIAELGSNPAFADLAEQAPTTIAGFPARVFEGRPVTGSRGFYADASTIGNDNAGWFPPAVLRLWLIDTDAGPVALTAESLVDPGQFDEARQMANGLLSTISFG